MTDSYSFGKPWIIILETCEDVIKLIATEHTFFHRYQLHSSFVERRLTLSAAVGLYAHWIHKGFQSLRIRHVISILNILQEEVNLDYQTLESK